MPFNGHAAMYGEGGGIHTTCALLTQAVRQRL